MRRGGYRSVLQYGAGRVAKVPNTEVGFGKGDKESATRNEINTLEVGILRWSNSSLAASSGVHVVTHDMV